MQVFAHANAHSFLGRAQAYLEREEALNNLPLGLAFHLRDHGPGNEPPFLATVEEGDLALVALMTSRRRNLIFYSDHPHPQEALSALARHLADSSWTLPGVVAPAGLALTFARVWREIVGQDFQVKMHMRVYQLTAVEHRGTAPGLLGPAQMADLDLAAQWLGEFSLAIGEDTGTREELRQSTADKIEKQTLFFWEDGTPVSMAARSRPTHHGITVNAVYTPPALRNQGYATSCVAALSQRLLDQGFSFCALFTDLANPTSNSIYQKIGYKPVGDFTQYRFL